MTHVLGRVFLAATLLLPLWRGEGMDRVQAQRGGVGRVDAAASTRTTKKTKDVVLGEVIQIGGSKFVKIGTNHWQAVKPYTCADPVLTYAGAVKNFDYTGGEQTYTAYAGCQYKIEVWGAQGGTANGLSGGYGGYSTGIFLPVIKQSIYIYVGSQGASGQPSSARSGGYNGGGHVTSSGAMPSNRYVAGGGGASHIALVSGLLKDIAAHKSNGNILLVAGGGGGGYYHTTGSPYYGTGGNAGGIGGMTGNGYDRAGTGGSQSAAGYCSANASVGKGGFGFGGDVAHSDAHGSAGGGGYYGGGGSCGESSISNSSGGGGSGYIGSSNLLSAAGITKHMTCYNCTTSTADATRTQSNTCVSGTPTPDCSKTGNGYARITRLN